MDIIYIDRKNHSALWNGIEISIPAAEIIIYQYQVLGYTCSNTSDSGLFCFEKKNLNYYIKRLSEKKPTRV